jgi:hypothetical protein
MIRPLLLDAHIYTLPCKGENKKTDKRCCNSEWFREMRREWNLVGYL